MVQVSAECAASRTERLRTAIAASAAPPSASHERSGAGERRAALTASAAAPASHSASVAR